MAVKKGGVRSLNKMNRDNLVQLKDPIRSEMNRTVVGTNKAIVTLMNKQLDLYHKDKNFELEKLRRRQDAVYATMLRVHKDKKTMQRSMYKKQQAEARVQARSQHPSTQADVLGLIETNNNNTPSEKQTDTQSEGKEPQKDSKRQTKSKENAKRENDAVGSGKAVDQETSNGKPTTFVKKSKVVEVNKRNPLAPITRERSDLQDEEETAGSKTSSSRLPVTKSSVVDILAIDSVAKAQSLPPISQSLPQVCQNVDKAKPNRKVSRNAVAMPTISEKEAGNRDTPTRHSDGCVYAKRKATGLVTEQDNNKLAPIPSAFEQTSLAQTPGNESASSSASIPKPKKGMKLSKLNRRKKAEKLRRFRENLDNEKLKVYIRDDEGRFVVSDAPFRRRDFQLPSMKEKHFQEKMLRAQVDARLEQRQKLESFFEKMAHEERERLKLRESFRRAAEQKAEEVRRAGLEEEATLGFSQSVLATLYSKGLLPEGMDPASFEAIRYCKYIRTHSPNSLEEARRVAQRDGKTSSWN